MPNQIGVPAPPAVGDVEDGAIDQAHLAYRICVPARNEADRIGTLLDALAEQDIAGPIPIVIGLNNTTDSSAGVISACRRRHAARLDIRVDEHLFPIECAHAGSARRRVMDIGLAWLGETDGVLVTTDADARPPKDWVSQNLRAIRDGADIVGGYLLIDDAEPLGSEAEAYSRLWHLYWAKVRAIEDEIDPRHWDPPPRHGDHTGASLALTARIYKGRWRRSRHSLGRRSRPGWGRDSRGRQVGPSDERVDTRLAQVGGPGNRRNGAGDGRTTRCCR